MSQLVSPLAGKPLPTANLVDVARLLAAYADLRPDPTVPAQRVAFGTSGHRGTSFQGSFNAWHVLAITQALCEHRKAKGINGPLFIGVDTHALSKPAFDDALQVLAANGVETMIACGGEFTPTPAVSHAILVYNRGRTSGLADGIVITPSHNPPDSGGFKYNPPHGGPADADITGWVQECANTLLEGGLKDVKRVALAQARKAATTHGHDYLGAYVADLGNVIDFDMIRRAVRAAIAAICSAIQCFSAGAVFCVFSDRFAAGLDTQKLSLRSSKLDHSAARGSRMYIRRI